MFSFNFKQKFSFVQSVPDKSVLVFKLCIELLFISSKVPVSNSVLLSVICRKTEYFRLVIISFSNHLSQISHSKTRMHNKNMNK